MRKPRSVRWWLKWGLTVGALLIGAAIPLSRWWTLIWLLPNVRAISVHNGCIWLNDSSGSPVGLFRSARGVFFGGNYGDNELFWRFLHLKTLQTELFCAPLWAPLIIFALPAALLWRTDLRGRKRVGHCPSCDYDLQGLTVGVACPECGAKRAGDTAAVTKAG